MMRRKIYLAGALLALVLLLTGCGQKPVAEVNGEKLMTEEFNRYLEQTKAYGEQMGITIAEGEEGAVLLAQAKQDTVDRWIEETLVFQAGEAEKVEVADSAVNSYLDERIKSSIGTDEQYQEWLTQQKLTNDDLLRLIRYQLTGQQIYEKLTAAIQISDQQAQAAYDADQTAWQKVKVSHILVTVARDTATQEELAAAKAKASDLIAQLDRGADFAQLAKTASGDPGSAAQGGVIDMVFSRQEQGLVPEFVEGAFQLSKVGDYSREPVLSQFGYHILKLDALQGSFADVSEDVKNQLLQEEKNAVYQKYMDDFKAKAKIVTNLPAAEAAE